jgi:hypothetical protein
MIQCLFYIGNDMYSYDFSLIKQIFVENDNLSAVIDNYTYFKDLVTKHKHSIFYALYLKINPQNGEVEILLNEMYKVPLKEKIVINKAVRFPKPSISTNPPVNLIEHPTVDTDTIWVHFPEGTPTTVGLDLPGTFFAAGGNQ